EHDIFTRDGDDLHCEVPIRISQAALGDVVRVPTLGGEAELRIPAETQSGKLFRLRGKGVRSVRSRAEGDLYCKVVVETPVNLTAEQRELLEKFESTFVGDSAARRHSPRSSTYVDGVKGFWDRMTSCTFVLDIDQEPSRAPLLKWGASDGVRPRRALTSEHAGPSRFPCIQRTRFPASRPPFAAQASAWP